MDQNYQFTLRIDNSNTFISLYDADGWWYVNSHGNIGPIKGRRKKDRGNSLSKEEVIGIFGPHVRLADDSNRIQWPK